MDKPGPALQSALPAGRAWSPRVRRPFRNQETGMATTANLASEQSATAWRGFEPGPWTEHVDVRDFIQRNYTPYEGDGTFLAGADRAHQGHVEDLAAAARGGAQEGHPRRLAGSLEHPRARAGLHRQGERDHRRPADRRAAEARDHAVRRLAGGRGEPRVLRLQARRAHRRDLHQVPQDPQRRRLRRLHRRHQGRPLLGNRHRPARCLRPRPDHRRLSPRRPLRRRLPDRRTSSARRRSWTIAIPPRT